MPDDVEQFAYSHLVVCLYPYAPHLAQEIWSKLYPEALDIRDYKIPDYAQILKSIQDTITFSVSLNGKFAGTIELSEDLIGDPEAIFRALRKEKHELLHSSDKGKSNKKIQKILEKENLSQFKRVIAPEKKPIINFIF